MNKHAAELLEQHFDTAFAAPDGIAKLRELILTLAMQGKLVEQDPNDPPASELLREIEVEKRRLVAEGKIKKPKPLPEIKPEEVPYELPQRWEWVRLGELIYLVMGQSPPSAFYNQKNDGLPFFQGKADFRELYPTPRYWCTNPKKYAFPNDVLLSVRAPVGPTNIAKFECCIGRGLAALRPLSGMSSFYIIYLMNRFRSRLEETATGTTFVAVSKTDVENLIVPAIPLPEQHRIVSRIDQLMASCDELEKLRKQREEKRLAVHAAAVKQLLEAPVGPAWKFIEQHFGELYTIKENVAELRKAILQLAVMGRLVEQDPNDPPASELLKEIEAEKRRLVAEGKIKKPKPLPEIKPEEVPHELPQGWEWVRLGDLIPEYQNGISKRGSNDGCETIVLRLADITGNQVSLENTRSIQLTDKELEKYRLNDGDILITRVNGSIDLVGSFIRVRKFQQPITYCDHFIRMRLSSSFVNVDYMHGISKGALIRSQIERKFVTTAGQKTVNQTHITTLVIPLPPLPEQHRIVARIDQLMALCDTLKQQIDAATSKQTELLGAVMAGM